MLLIDEVYRSAPHIFNADVTSLPVFKAMLGEDASLKVRPEDLLKATVVKADNVAEYVKAHVHGPTYYPETLDCVAPPYPSMWLEYRTPVKAWYEGETFDAIAHHGVYLVSSHIKKDPPPDLAAYVKKGWLGELFVFSKFVSPRVLDHGISLLGVFMIGLNDQGKVTHYLAIPNKGALGGIKEATGEAVDAKCMVEAAILPALYTLLFMNCKNIKVSQPPPIPPKLAKAAAARGRPRFQHRELVLAPFREAMKQATGSERFTPAALHFCRGHFKDFTKTGMFGKDYLKGRYWVPAHARGNETSGVIEKDYNLDLNPTKK